MYDIIQNIIDHTYVTNYSGDQQYIYYICGAMIILLTVIFVDMIRGIFRGFSRG